MRKLIFLFMIFFSTISLNSQVSFELDFNFEKASTEDELVNLQLFDYDNDGIEEIVVSYKSDFYENCWRIICYSQSGSILEEFSQENSENEFFQKGYIFKNNNINYLLTTFIYRVGVFLDEVYLRIKLFNFDTNSLICENDHLIGIGQSDDTYISYSISTTDIIHQVLPMDEIVFYIGAKHHKNTYTTMVSEYTSRDKSMIYKFKLINNNFIYLEEIENVGEKIVIYDVYDWIISTGIYYFYDWSEVEMVESKSRHYRISIISPELQSQVQEVYHIYGSYNNWFGEEFYENYPNYFAILTNNDLYFNISGLIAYHKEFDTDVGSSMHFVNFTPNFADSIWIEGNSFIGDGQITSSTCISVNNEDYYVMYFRGDQLEIRNRTNGNIIHYQNSSISPFKIDRKSDDELLFFVEQENETGYDVYVIDGEIQVSTHDNQINISVNNLSNYPNPFNPSTTIEFSIHNDSNVELVIFNIKGQKVKQLVSDQHTAGQHSIVWNGEDNFGNSVSSGIYFYQLKIDGKVRKSKKMILMK